MAEASTSATREGHPSDTDRVAPTGEKDMKGDEMYQQIHLVEMIVSSKRQLLENVTRIIAVQRKGIQPSDLQAFKEELCKERDHLNTLKLNLNEYRLQLIGKEKEQISELSAGKQEWAFNREQRQWLYLRRELMYEKQKLRDVSQAGGQASTQELPGEDKHSELDYSDKPLAALKRLKAAEAGLADELTFIQRSSEEDLSRAGRPAILFHFEQLVWHQRMWVCNLEEVLPGQETDVGSEKQGRIVTELRKVVEAQKELIKILEDALEQRKVSRRQFKMAEIQSGTTKELVELISEQTRLVEASDPVQEYSGELQRVDLMVEEFACINVRWEVIFEHQRLRGHRRQPLQKAVVESVEMLRQQVYALGLNHREIYQPLDIRLDLEEDILLKQMTFWGGVIESYWDDWLSLDVVPEAGTCRHEFVGQGASSVQPAVSVEGFGAPGISIEGDRSPDQGDSQVLGLGMIDGSALPIIGQLHSSQPPKFSDDAFLLDDSSSDSTPSPPTSPAYLPSESRESQKDDASTQPTRLQLILQEHDKQIAGLSDSELQESIFQLPYIAISYFNEMGGSLSLKEYNVHLYIPRGALPAGSLKKVYIYVNPNAPPIEGLGGQDIPLSPMIQCGPTGLQFRDRVVLSFPHHAKEGTGWNFSAHICSNDEDDSKTWQALDSQDDGILVSTKNQKAVLLMSHFCGAALTSQDQSVAKIVKVGTFGADLDLSEDWYPVRIHLWNNDPVAEKNVMDTELRHDVSSQQLDVPRDLEVVFNQGDVQVEIGNVSEGWQAEDAQTILKSRIWKYCTNSVTFDFERQSHCEKSLHCKGYVCQVGPPEAGNARTEDKVKLRIRPRRTKNVKPDEKEMRVQDQPSADSKENLDGARVKKEPGKMYGDYGGLSPQALQDIGKRLEAGDGADQLTDESLTGARLIAMISFMEVFKLFFADQRASQVSDKDAVKSLRQTLKRKNLEVSEMLWEEGLESDSKHNKRDSRSLSEDVASSEIAEQQRLWKLSRQLEAEWEELATYLGITSAELFRIKSDHAGNVGNQMHAMLDLWWRKGRPDSELVEALREVERHDLAEQVQEHQQQQQEQQQQQQQQQQQPLNGNTFHEIRRASYVKSCYSRSSSEGSLSLSSESYVKSCYSRSSSGGSLSLSSESESSSIFPQVETPIVVHTSPDGAGNVQGSPSTPPTHLKRVLEKHNKFAKDCSEDTLKDNTFQLPYIAIGYFDHNGGSLSLDKYNIHLYIPRGALPKGRLQQVYIYVNPNAPPVDGIDPSDCVLSPMIQCGPTGLKFLASVMLSFPHFAKEGSGWELRAQLCNDEEGSLKTWNNLHANDDGVLVSTKDKTVVLLMKHFTGATLVGQPSATSTKTMMAGVFGTPFDQSKDLYSFRFHLWNDEPVVKQKVVESENEMGSKLLDAYRSLIVCRSGDVDAEIENMKPGWEMATPTLQKQTISVGRIWELPTDSVTFDLQRYNLNEAPHCDAFISQEASTGGRVRFSIKPEKRESIPQTDKPRPCYKCRHDAAGEICPSCEEAMECVPVLKNRDLSDGDYGGLSEEMECAVCGEADLARVLVGAGLADVGQSSMESPDSLTVFFGHQRARGVQDGTAVKRLLESLDEHIVKKVRKELRVAAPENSPADGSTSTGNPEDSSWLASEIAVEQRFRWLATRLESEWEALATWLRLTNADLSKIKDEYRYAVSNQIFAMLVEWKRRSGRWDESILAEALKKVGRLDLAQQFQEIRTTSGCEVIENIK